MKNVGITPGIRAPKSSKLTRSMRALALVLGLAGSLFAAPERASASDSSSAQCGSSYDPGVSYPALSTPNGADLSGEAGVFVYMHADRAVAELDDCFYTLDRELLIDVGTLDTVVMLLELPDHSAGATVFVTEDGAWIDTLELSGPLMSYVLDPHSSYGFEVAAPGQEHPVTPIVKTKPTSEDPAP